MNLGHLVRTMGLSLWWRNVLSLLISRALWDPRPELLRVFISLGSSSVGAPGPEERELWRMTASHFIRSVLFASAHGTHLLFTTARLAKVGLDWLCLQCGLTGHKEAI